MPKKQNGKQMRNRQSGSQPNKSKNKRKTRIQDKLPSMQSTNIPVQSAVNVQQSIRNDTNTIVGSEIIGFVQVGGSTPSGNVQTFDLSPALLVGTRLAAMAKLYQRFRFVSAELLINSNVSTTTTGSLVVGFTSNVDWEPTAARATTQIFSLPGAKSVRLWTPTAVKAVMTPLIPNAWYINDSDSAEVMWTNQGKFLIAIESPASLENITQIPIVLSYKVQFSLPIDSAAAASGALVFPQMTWTATTGGYFDSYTASAGEVAAPALVTKVLYEMMPAPAITRVSPGGASLDLIPLVYVMYYTGKLYLYQLEHLEDARNFRTESAYPVSPSTTWTTTRMVAVPV